MPGDADHGLKNSLRERLDQLAMYLQRANFIEFMQLVQSPGRLIWTNFLAGLARGFGIAVGFTAMGALFIYMLGLLASLNLPVIGEFVANLVRIVQQQLSSGRFPR